LLAANLLFGCVMAQAVCRWPVITAAWVRAQVNPVGFVVDKVALGQVFLRVLRFSPVNIIPPWAPHFRKLKKSFIHSPLHSSSSGDGQKARKSGHSPVRRQSHPHNQNPGIGHEIWSFTSGNMVWTNRGFLRTGCLENILTQEG
jgi:hypothetical protein